MGDLDFLDRAAERCPPFWAKERDSLYWDARSSTDLLEYEKINYKVGEGDKNIDKKTPQIDLTLDFNVVIYNTEDRNPGVRKCFAPNVSPRTQTPPNSATTAAHRLGLTSEQTSCRRRR